MILNRISLGEIAQCYFPKLIQESATRKLVGNIRDRIPVYYELMKYKWILDGELNPLYQLETGDVVIIGMNLGYPREILGEDVRDTITWGYNKMYDLKDPEKRKRTCDAFMKLDCRLNPPLEFYDCEEIKEESK